MKKKIKHSETVVYYALKSSGNIPTCRYIDTIIFKYKFNRKGLWEYFYTLRSIRGDRSILYWNCILKDTQKEKRQIVTYTGTHTDNNMNYVCSVHKEMASLFQENAVFNRVDKIN